MHSRKPSVIQFPINNICNSKCQMCNIWQQRKEHEITPLEIYKALSNDLFSDVSAIGLNGGEPTLRDDLSEVAKACIESLPNLRSIALITNGLRPHLVIPRVEGLYATTKEANVNLSIMISLDGVGDIHDLVRGRKGNFSATQECMSYFLANSVGDYHSYGCTLIKDNIQHAEKLMLFARDQNIYCRFRVGIPHQRLYNRSNDNTFSLSGQERFHLANFLETLIFNYETDNARKVFLRNLRNQVAYYSPRANGCAWQGEGVTLESNGNLSYCAVQSPSIGNLIESPADAASFYFNSIHIRDQILESKCDTCLHDYSGKNYRILEASSNSIHAQKALIQRVKSLVPAQIKVPVRSLKPIFRSLALKLYGEYRFIRMLSSEYLQYLPVKKAPSSLRGDEHVEYLIVGWYGTETLGDKAILYSVIDSLRLKSSDCCQITIASIEPYITRYTLEESNYSEGCAVVSIPNAKKLALEGRFTAVVFAGGPLMSSIPYLRDIAKIFRAAYSRGCNCLVWGCGIGPIRKARIDSPNKIAISTILKYTTSGCFRDHASYRASLEFYRSDKLSSVDLDPAYFWFRESVKSSSSPSDPFAPNANLSNRKHILFALRDLPLGEYFSGLSASEAAALSRKYRDSVVRLIREVRDGFGDVYLQPMHRLSCGGDDRLFYASVLKGSGLEALVNWIHEKPVDDVRRFVDSNLCIVMRYHSLVLALAARKPLVAIDYTSGGKVAALCAALNIKPLSISEFASSSLDDLLQASSSPAEYGHMLDSLEVSSGAGYAQLVASLSTHSLDLPLTSS